MRLTLNLHDYIDKYLDIRTVDEIWCPICYEDVMSDSKENNMKHMIDCYKHLRVELALRSYKEKNGYFPKDLEDFSKDVTDKVKDEMMSYYFKYAEQQKQK
jgi:hypothetical protein